MPDEFDLRFHYTILFPNNNCNNCSRRRYITYKSTSDKLKKITNDLVFYTQYLLTRHHQ